MKPITKTTPRKKLLEFLGTLRKDEIREVIDYFNDLPESKFPYLLKTSGTKEQLIEEVRSEKLISQSLLYTAINRTLKGTDSFSREEFDDIWENKLDKALRDLILNYVETHLTQGLNLKLMATYFNKDKVVAAGILKICKAYIKYRVPSY